MAGAAVNTAGPALVAALHAFQNKAGEITLLKDARNPHIGNRYISLGALIDAILPVANECNLVFSQLPDVTADGKPALTTALWELTSGECYERTTPLVLADKMLKDGKREPPGPQEHGSAITYMRRYALMAALGLVADEDDDAHRASGQDSARRDAGLATEGPGEASTFAVAATEPQRKALRAVSHKLHEQGLIDAEALAKVTQAAADEATSKEWASKAISRMKELEKEATKA